MAQTSSVCRSLVCGLLDIEVDHLLSFLSQRASKQKIFELSQAKCHVSDPIIAVRGYGPNSAVGKWDVGELLNIGVHVIIGVFIAFKILLLSSFSFQTNHQLAHILSRVSQHPYQVKSNNSYFSQIIKAAWYAIRKTISLPKARRISVLLATDQYQEMLMAISLRQSPRSRQRAGIWSIVTRNDVQARD